MKTIIPIQGMHCRSCEILIEDELLKVPGVSQVAVSQVKGIAKVYSDITIPHSDIAKAVQNAGYSIGDTGPKPWFTKDLHAYGEIGVMVLLLLVVFYIGTDSGLFKFADFGSNNFASLPIVFMIGLTAGISTCAALVGGLVLSISARFATQNPGSSALEKFRPHLYFNLGRVLSFFILGALIGYAGSIFRMSLTTLGLLTIGVGIVMLFFGAQLTELFPRLSTISFTLPTGISKALGIKQQTQKSYSNKNAMVIGALTFFLPCGFTQVVQLFAISTGSPVTAALTMGIFALGTTPGLLGIGGLTALVKGSFGRTFFRFAGVVVIALAMFNIANGFNLSGIRYGSVLPATTQDINGTKGETTTPSGDVQVIKTVFTARNDIQPNQFTVKMGQPVRMEIDVQDDGFGCMGSFALPRLSPKVDMLVKGQTLVYEFTPQSQGAYPITCAMGISRGIIKVI